MRGEAAERGERETYTCFIVWALSPPTAAMYEIIGTHPNAMNATNVTKPIHCKHKTIN